MKKRIVSMILALSMMLSILPVSAFADAGAGLSSAAEETNSITYSSENEHEDVGTNSETNNQVVKIKIGTDGLPKAAAGTGWSYDDATKSLTITGIENEKTEYILDGTVSCSGVTLINASGATVYLLDGVVTRKLRINADNTYGVYVLGGRYANVELNNGTIDGGTYDKLTENGGSVWGGFFRDISGLSAITQQQAHQLLLPAKCTLNGQKESEIYIIKPYNYYGNGNDLELVVESDTGCNAWAVASTGGNAMPLLAGTQNYTIKSFGTTIATVSISDDGKTLSASFSMVPAQNGAPLKLIPMVFGNTELHFNSEGQPDLTDVTYVDSLDADTDAKLFRIYVGNGWGYTCYPNDSSMAGTVQIQGQDGEDFDFSALSDGPINCSVEITNANITGGEFGQRSVLTITSGKISGGTFHNVSAGISSIDGSGAVEITGGTFDALYCNGSCTISNAVIQSCNFNTYGNNTYTISDTVLGELPDGIQNLLADGQQLSTLLVRNGNVTAMNGRTLPLSTNTIYLVGAGSAELTLNTDVRSINDAPVSSYNANTSADGRVLHITGNNDGAEIYVNKSTDPSDLKPLRITEEGLPDLTGVTGVQFSEDGMTANLYEGLGWKYATMEEDGVERTALYITTPDGNPVDLASGAINENQVPIAVEQITFANVTVAGIVAEGSVGVQNTIIQDGTFQKDVYMDGNSTIAGGTFQDVVRAYGTITGGAFNAEVQLNQNSEVTGGVFHDIRLVNDGGNRAVIRNAMILGSLKTDSDSKAVISNTVSCGYIESGFLAAGQQQSKLMIADGTVEAVNGNAAATDAVYLVGETEVTLTFSTKVTNINGEDVSAYNGAQLSEDGKTLTLTAKNDGEPIVVNMAASGKLPFSSLSKSDFTVSGTIEHQTVTSSKEDVGELSLVYVRTYDGTVFANYLATSGLPGVYKQRIVAKEGKKYTDGSLDIGEVVRKYLPNSTDFEYDPKTQTANYKGPMYFDDAPQYSIQYVTEDGSSASVTKPTKAGTYSVCIVVNYSDHYYGTQYEVDTYTVTDSEKLPFSSLKASNFTVEGTVENPIITCDQEGVGELSFVSVRTDNKAELDHFPSETDYGSYKIYIEATDGERYTAGRVLLTEETLVRKYRPTRGNFNLDLDAGTATYNGPKYYGSAVPKATLKYSATNDFSTATATVPTEAGTYYVWLAVEYDDYYYGSNDQLPEGYTVAEKLPFEGFTMDDFDIDMDDDGNYTVVCKTADGVGELSTKLECLTGVNKGKTFINREPDEDAYGRYQGSIVAKDGKKYKAGSIVVVEDSLRYTPVTTDFAYDATKNTVEYKGKNYYDADPQMTLLYGTEQSETVPTTPGSYDVYVKVTAGKNYIADAYSDDSYRIYQVGTYTVADSEKLPFEGFTKEDFKPIGNGDYTYTLVCTKADGVGELTLEYKGLTGVNKGKTYINRDPDIDAYGRYQVTVTAKEGAKYKPGSIDLGEYTFRYTPKAADFAYDATKNTVTYNIDKNYYDADPDMTLLYGTDQSETVPTAPGSYDVYVRVTADDNYEAVTTEKVGTYDVPEPTKPKYHYYWNAQEGKEHNEGDKITLSVDKKEGNNVIWKIEGLAEDAYTITDTGTHIELQFFMPSNDVRVTNHYEPIYYTLTVDGKEERRAFGKEVTFTAPEKEGHTFTGWEVDGVPEGTDTTSETIRFTMPANNVTLTPQYKKNTYTLTVDGVDEPRDFDEDVTVTAQPVEGKTFTGWKVTGLSADVDTTSETIRFKMPANNVTLEAQYKQNTYTLTVNGKPEQRTAGEEVTLTARKPDGMTFKNWEIKKGLPADAVDINSETINFTMPANDVEISAIYIKDSTPDPDPETKTHKLEVKNAQIFLKDGSDVADLKTVPVGTELKAIAYEDTETNVFKCWTGLDLTEEQSTARVVEFTMPDHDVNLMAVFVTPTNKLEVTNAQVTLKDGSAVADLTAVPAGTELVATAPERDGYTFTGWTATGLPANANIDGATVTFKMPANKVTLNAKYIANAPKKYTVTMGEENTDYAVDADVSITAPKKEGYTFTGWEVTGLSADVDTTKATITFKMPANNVTLTPQYTEIVPEKYTVTMGEKNTDYAVDADVSITAPEKEGYTFTGWDVTGLSADVDTTSETITFKMPANNVTLTPQYMKDSTPTPAPGGDSDGGGAIVIVAAVGGAAIGVGAYIAGTTAYLKSVLPEGMAIPANRQQLAVALWTAAGKPATQSTALFNDVAADAAELQAIRWVVETGLMTAQDGNFKPGSHVGRMEVIRVWKAYQQRG